MSDTAQFPFDSEPLRRRLRQNGFEDINMRTTTLNNGLTVPLVAFSHRPCDTRTACVCALPTGGNLDADLRRTQQTGAPLVFVNAPGKSRWDIWFHKGDDAQMLWHHTRGPLDDFFKVYPKQITPGAIFRAKTLGRLQTEQQLTFVDAGTFNMVEAQAGRQLCELVERMMRVTSEHLRWENNNEQLSEKQAQWLVKANFWLLAARLLRDKEVSNFKQLNLADIETTFDRVTKHYGASIDQNLPNNRRQALVKAAAELARYNSLALTSTETLAYVYENALITKQTRRMLGTHSTPTWLVDYIFSRLAPWIEEMPADRRYVYEPTCGHAPFLLGALRVLTAMEPCVTQSDSERHAWLKRRLRGAEIDDFAREVARLSLTLADIPNCNGWCLDEGDLFQGTQIETHLRRADIVVANPPFERGGSSPEQVKSLSPFSKAAEMLRQIAIAANPGTLVGLVMPQTVLDSHKAQSLRAALWRDFEWLEILRLPGQGVFKVANVESAVLIGRRQLAGKTQVQGTVFKNVEPGNLTDFRETGIAAIEQTRQPADASKPPNYTMLLPDLAEVWDYLSGRGTLEEVAEVGQGFSFKSETDSSFPKNETQISTTKKSGYALGFYDFPKTTETHQLPPLTWLNRNRQAIRRPHSGYTIDIPQVVLNYVRISIGAWRIAAYIDEKGRPVTSNYLVVRPKKNIYSLSFLWAILNSPITNAFSKAHTSKRQNLAGTIRKLPLPQPTNTQIKEIENAAQAYRQACLSRPSAKSRRHKTNAETDAPTLPGLLPDDVSPPLLRDLHWRMDAAVFRLYNLSPKLERRVLDYFSGHTRERVPFEQEEYLPRDFTAINTLDELLAITVDWPEHNERRSDLIDKEYEDKITIDELRELKRLQKQTSLRRQLLAPYPMRELEEEVERLKWEGKWDE
ncbi:MAG: N-6 DNA methylase [Verrucomicrobiales bacterium]|nr:N-6 DNA methylase [Verrucomicrobiales bacterium]